MVSISPYCIYFSSCDTVPNYSDSYNSIGLKGLMIENNSCDKNHYGWTVTSVWDGTVKVKWDYAFETILFHRNPDFCQKFFLHQLFFLNSFLYSLTYFLFFHQNQVIDFDWGGWNTVAIYLDLFLCAWFSLDDLHSVDLLRLSPWRGRPLDGHVSIINGEFIIRSCTLGCWRWRTVSSAAANPRVCPPGKHRSFTYTCKTCVVNLSS